MTRAARCLAGASAVLLILLAVPSTADAQLVQSVTFGGGYFWPKGYDGRVQGDVLVANLTQPVVDIPSGATTSLDFEIGDFGAWTLFGEWNIAFNKNIEASAGLGFYKQTVNSRYRDLVNRPAGDTDILQDLKLQQIPITGLVRFLFGEPGKIQPYAGAGLTAVRFKYVEEGEFVDPVDLSIFCAGTPGCPFPAFEGSGFALGPVFVGGVRLPIGGDIYAFTAEGRWTLVDGDTGGEAAGFLGDRIDLGGFTFNMGLMIRF
jgi:hypothetical protein